VIPLASAVATERIDDARRALALGADEQVALYFGANFAAKDPQTVWRGFASLPNWRLLVAGSGTSAAFRAWAEHEPDAVPGLHVVGEGFVDELTKARLYSVADLLVVSFHPGRNEDSASLTDAISWGVPVVCSSGGHAAELVMRYGLGVLFEAGDASSLVEAVTTAPREPDPAGLQRARHDLSFSTAARRCLALAGACAQGRTTSS
jgi:glycosyltransferase involved in cell wall biosynthesis